MLQVGPDQCHRNSQSYPSCLTRASHRNIFLDNLETRSVTCEVDGLCDAFWVIEVHGHQFHLSLFENGANHIGNVGPKAVTCNPVIDNLSNARLAFLQFAKRANAKVWGWKHWIWKTQSLLRACLPLVGRRSLWHVCATFPANPMFHVPCLMSWTCWHEMNLLNGMDVQGCTMSWVNQLTLSIVLMSKPHHDVKVMNQGERSTSAHSSKTMTVAITLMGFMRQVAKMQVKVPSRISKLFHSQV